MYFKLLIIFVLNFQISASVELADRALVKPRIYGGEQKTIQKLGGYAVQIYLGHKIICAGGLLSARHVLTSAHCFGDASYDHYHVIAGQTEPQQYFYSERIKNKVLKLKIHPKFQKTKFIADIAVVAISAPIRGPDVGYLPICSVKPAAGRRVTVAGWGDSEHSLTYNTLRSIEVPLITETECNKKMERQMPSNVLCAAGYNKRTICKGDSGGPMVINGELCGISTWTWKCGNEDMPDIYMSVYFYRDFIKKTVAEMGD